MIVSDAGPIINFARIGRLSLLRDIVGSLVIPDGVHGEIVVAGNGMRGAAEVAAATRIQRATVLDSSMLASLPSVLHGGEREAIVLAKERGGQLLVDEHRARRVAADLGIEVIGTLRLLAAAKRLGHIALAGTLIVEMQSNGYRFDRTLIRTFLERIGEH